MFLCLLSNTKLMTGGQKCYCICLGIWTKVTWLIQEHVSGKWLLLYNYRKDSISLFLSLFSFFSRFLGCQHCMQAAWVRSNMPEDDFGPLPDKAWLKRRAPYCLQMEALQEQSNWIYALRCQTSQSTCLAHRRRTGRLHVALEELLGERKKKKFGCFLTEEECWSSLQQTDLLRLRR